MWDASLQLVPDIASFYGNQNVRQIRALSEQLEGKPLIEPSVPAAASRAAAPLGTTRAAESDRAHGGGGRSRRMGGGGRS